MLSVVYDEDDQDDCGRLGALEADAMALHEASIAFVGAGLYDKPWKGLMVEAVTKARRAVAGYLARNEPVDDWLSSEVRLRGIRENAAVLAVLEVPQLREKAAELYRREHSDRAQILSALLAVLGPRAASD